MPGISGQSFSVPTPPITGQEVGVQDMSIARPAINPNVVGVRDFGEINQGVDLTVTNQAISTATTTANTALAAATGALNAELVAHLATLDPAANPCVSVAGRGAGGDQGGGTFVSVLVAGGPAIDNAMVFASSNALWRWKRVYTDHLSPAWFGAFGDGVTNDTAALQAALDATITYGVPLRCEALATYLVRYASALYNGAALVLKHGTRLDLNGATLKLDDDQWCSVIINEHIAGGGPDHVEIENGIIDGNEANQTRVWSAGAWKRAVGGVLITFTPTVCFFNLASPYFADLTIDNSYIAAFKVQACTNLVLHDLTMTGGWGDGCLLTACTDATINNIYASNLRHVGEHPSWGSSWGQGIVWHLTRASVGTVTLTNCQTPGKVQDGSTDIVWDKLFCVAGPLTCLPTTATPPDYGIWWGIKFQGSNPAPHNARIKIGSITCDATDPTINFAVQSIGAGLYLYASDDVEVGSYTGLKCGRGVYYPGYDWQDYFDIVIHNCPRLRIRSISTDNCDGNTIYQQTSGAGTETDTIDIGEINVVDPQYSTRVGVTGGPQILLPIGSSHWTAGKIHLTETVAPAYPTRILNALALAADFSGSVHIGEVVQNQPINASMFVNNPDAAIARVIVDRVRLAGMVKPFLGVNTLANGAGSTPVAAAEVSSWSALSPIVAVQPQNASAAALGLATVVPAVAPATGFTLNHGVAGASDVVNWQCLGYSSLEGLLLDRVWTALVIGGGSPPARHLACMAYVGSLDRSLLFAGNDAADSPLNDLWSFNHNARTWTQLVPATNPAVRRGAFMCYDATRDRVVMYGGYDPVAGYLHDTYEYYGANWHVVATAHDPGDRYSGSSCAMAFDSSRGVCLLYSASAIWEYDGVDWTQTHGVLPNTVISHAALAFVPPIGKVIIFGGLIPGGAAAGDIYSWDGTTLTLIHTSANTAMYHSMVWDSNRQVLVAADMDLGFGTPSNRTFEWTSHDFALMTEVMPTNLVNGAGVFNPIMDEVMVFGGSTTGAAANATDITRVYRRG